MKPLVVALGFLLAFVAPAAAATEAEALAAKQSGDFPRAIGLYEQLVAAEPTNASHLLQLGTVLSWAGRFDEALAVLDHGLALAPHDHDLQMARGRVLAWSGHHGRAEEIFRGILAENPNHRDARTMLGRVQLWTRQFLAAEQSFDAVLASAPTDPEALLGRGDVERLQDRPDAARAYYERAHQADPQSPDIRHRLESVRRAGRWRLDAGAEVSGFPGNTREDWSGWDAALRYAIDKRTGVSLGVEHARRFGLTDHQYTLGGDRRFSDDLSGYVRWSATPNADFFAKNMVAFGGAWRARRGDPDLPATVLLADYRAATYGPGTAHTLWLGVTQYTNRRVAVTLRGLTSRNLNERWTSGWQFRLDGEPADHWRWHLGYADSNESLSSTVFDFTRKLRTRALFAGFYYEFSPSLGLRIDLTHEWAAGLPDRNAIHAGFTTRF